MAEIFYDWRMAYPPTAGAMGAINTVSTHVLGNKKVTDIDCCTLCCNFSVLKSNEKDEAMTVTRVILIPFDIVKSYQRQSDTITETNISTLLADHVFKDMPRPSNYAKNNTPEALIILLKAHSYDIPINEAFNMYKQTKNSRPTLSLYAGLTSAERAVNMPQVVATFFFHKVDRRTQLSTIKLEAVPVTPLARIKDVVFGKPGASPTVLSPMMKTQTDTEYLESLAPFAEPQEEEKAMVPALKRKASDSGDVDVMNDELQMVTNISAVNIDSKDIDELARRFFFTDNVVHALILKTIKSVPVTELDDVYVFNSFLMDKLMHTMVPEAHATTKVAKVEYIFNDSLKMYATIPDTSDSSGNKRLSCLLDKKFIFIPVNAAEHWALYIFHEPFNGNRTTPLLYVLDSILRVGASGNTERSQIPSHIHREMMAVSRLYLANVARTYGDGKICMGIVDKERRIRSISVPQQPPGSNACGYYLCEFVRHLLKDRKTREQIAHDMMTHIGFRPFQEEFSHIDNNSLLSIRAPIIEMLTNDMMRAKAEATKKKRVKKEER